MCRFVAAPGEKKGRKEETTQGRLGGFCVFPPDERKRRGKEEYLYYGGGEKKKPPSGECGEGGGGGRLKLFLSRNTCSRGREGRPLRWGNDTALVLSCWEKGKRGRDVP